MYKKNITFEKIKKQISKNNIILYMKGSPKFPSCGFSAKAAQTLAKCGKKFAYVDVLTHSDIRSELPKFSNWPTFPQLWVQGNFIGGCDIILNMYKSGKLQELIQNVSEITNEKKDICFEN